MTIFDVRCFDDLDEFGGELRLPEDALEQLEQDNYHRIITPRGGNPDDPSFGLGLEELLSGDLDPAIGSLIEAELRRDPRNGAVRAVVTEAGETMRIDIEIETDDGEMLSQSIEADAGGVRRVT
jgi:hypothetical protein